MARAEKRRDDASSRHAAERQAGLVEISKRTGSRMAGDAGEAMSPSELPVLLGQAAIDHQYARVGGPGAREGVAPDEERRPDTRPDPSAEHQAGLVEVS